MSSPIMSVSVDSGRFDSVSGPHIPSLGQISAPVSWDDAQFVVQQVLVLVMFLLTLYRREPN